MKNRPTHRTIASIGRRIQHAMIGDAVRTHDEIAQAIGTTRQNVQQIECIALGKVAVRMRELRKRGLA